MPFTWAGHETKALAWVWHMCILLRLFLFCSVVMRYRGDQNNRLAQSPCILCQALQ